MPHQCTDCGRHFDDGSKEMLSGCPNCGGNKFQFLPEGSADSQQQPTPEEPPSVDEPGSSVARKVGSAATAVRDFVNSSSRETEPDRSSGPESSPTAEPAASADSGRSRDSPPRARADQSASTAQSTQSGSSPQPTKSTAQPDNSAPTASSAGQSRTDRRETGHTPGESEPESASMPTAESENSAQASARSEVISSDELPPSPEPSGWQQTKPGPHPQPESERPESQQTEQSPESTAENSETERTERPDLSELRAELNEQFESIKVVEPGQYELNLMELFDRQEYIIALQEDGKYTVQVPEHWQD